MSEENKSVLEHPPEAHPELSLSHFLNITAEIEQLIAENQVLAAECADLQFELDPPALKLRRGTAQPSATELKIIQQTLQIEEKELEEIAPQIAQLESDCADLTTQLAAENHTLSQTREKVGDLEKEYESFSKYALDELSLKLKAKEDQRKKMHEKLEAIKKENSAKRTQLDKLRKQDRKQKRLLGQAEKSGKNTPKKTIKTAPPAVQHREVDPAKLEKICSETNAAAQKVSLENKQLESSSNDLKTKLNLEDKAHRAAQTANRAVEEKLIQSKQIAQSVEDEIALLEAQLAAHNPPTLKLRRGAEPPAIQNQSVAHSSSVKNTVVVDALADLAAQSTNSLRAFSSSRERGPEEKSDTCTNQEAIDAHIKVLMFQVEAKDKGAFAAYFEEIQQGLSRDAESLSRLIKVSEGVIQKLNEIKPVSKNGKPKGKKKNKKGKKKVKSYESIAKESLAYALCRLGDCYERGEGVVEDKVEAKCLYERALALGSPVAKMALLFLEEDMSELKANPPLLDRNTTWDAISVAEDVVVLTSVVLQHRPENEKTKQGFQALLKAMLKKKREIMNLGALYIETLCEFQKSLSDKQFEQYKKIMGEVFCDLGGCYEVGKAGREKDTEKAAAIYQFVAEEGDSLGQACLAACYEAGIGVKKDKNEAVRLYTLAAEQANAAAKHRLSKLLSDMAESAVADAVDELEEVSDEADSSLTEEDKYDAASPHSSPSSHEDDQNMGAVGETTPGLERRKPNGAARLTSAMLLDLAQLNKEVDFKAYLIDRLSVGQNLENLKNLGEDTVLQLKTLPEADAKRYKKIVAESYRECGVHAEQQGSLQKAALLYEFAAAQGDALGARYAARCYEQGIGVSKKLVRAGILLSLAEGLEAKQHPSPIPQPAPVPPQAVPAAKPAYKSRHKPYSRRVKKHARAAANPASDAPKKKPVQVVCWDNSKVPNLSTPESIEAHVQFLLMAARAKEANGGKAVFEAHLKLLLSVGDIKGSKALYEALTYGLQTEIQSIGAPEVQRCRDIMGNIYYQYAQDCEKGTHGIQQDMYKAEQLYIFLAGKSIPANIHTAAWRSLVRLHEVEPTSPGSLSVFANGGLAAAVAPAVPGPVSVPAPQAKKNATENSMAFYV